MGLKRKDHILIDYTSWFGAARQNRAAVRGPGAIEGPSAILPYGREKEERMNQKYRKENGVRGRRERKRERERERKQAKWWREESIMRRKSAKGIYK